MVIAKLSHILYANNKKINFSIYFFLKDFYLNFNFVVIAIILDSNICSNHFAIIFLIIPTGFYLILLLLYQNLQYQIFI